MKLLTLEDKLQSQWIRLSSENAIANSTRLPSTANSGLDQAANSDPHSPLAAVYMLWAADNLSREGRYEESLRAYDEAVDRSRNTQPFMSDPTPDHAALRHKAQSSRLMGDSSVAIATYVELAQISQQERAACCLQ